jgi:isopentenyl diphosphate isomerase/L-lactate dehydrogenase-like FMN-dependent dehydrogenase
MQININRAKLTEKQLETLHRTEGLLRQVNALPAMWTLVEDVIQTSGMMYGYQIARAWATGPRTILYQE